jgi:hypothetical protein
VKTPLKIYLHKNGSIPSSNLPVLLLPAHPVPESEWQGSGFQEGIQGEWLGRALD